METDDGAMLEDTQQGCAFANDGTYGRVVSVYIKVPRNLREGHVMMSTPLHRRSEVLPTNREQSPIHFPKNIDGVSETTEAYGHTPTRAGRLVVRLSVSVGAE